MVKRPAVEHAPWMIRSFPAPDRERYVAHAKDQEETTAAWVRRACEELYQRENNAVIIGPMDGKQGGNLDGNQMEMPAVHMVSVSIDAAGHAALVQSLLNASHAGQPVKCALRDTLATIRMAMREARGLSPRKTVKQLGKTIEG